MKMKKPTFAKKKNFKYGTVATAITIGFVALVVVINIIATLLLQKFPLSIDLTSSGKYEISQESIDYVQQLDRSVTIYVLADEASFNDPASEYVYQVGQLLRRYSQYSDKITVTYVDVENNPGFAAGYQNESLSTGDLIVQSDLRYQKFNWQDMFDLTLDSTGQYITEIASKAEQTLTSAILYVTDDDPVRVTFVNGHDEAELPALQELFTKNGYEIDSVNTLGAEIDPDTQVLVIVAAQRDFTEFEVDKLDAFLTNGGSYGKQLYYIADPSQPDMPNLETFLEEWGIRFMDGVVQETDKDKSYSKSPFFSMQDMDHLNNEFLGRTDPLTAWLVMPNTRPIEALYESQYNFTLNVLAQTYSSTVLYPSNAWEDDSWEASGATKQPFNTIVATQKATDAGGIEEDRERSTVVAFGSASMFVSDLMSTNLGNAQFTIDLTNQLTGKQDGITVVPVDMTAATLEINATQAIVLGIVFVAVLPLAVLICGLVVFLRRRNL
ncbi:MAG: Gldg family protein [Oscillospiraceae bacterium]